MLKHKNWLVLVLLVLFLSACSKEKEKTAKVLKEQPTNIPIDNDLSKRLAEFAAKPRVKGKFAFHVYDLIRKKKGLKPRTLETIFKNEEEETDSL